VVSAEGISQYLAGETRQAQPRHENAKQKRFIMVKCADFGRGRAVEKREHFNLL